MPTQSEIETQLAALYAARASSATRVRFGDREVQYRTLTEINQAIATLESQLAQLQGTGVTQVYARTTGGF